MSVRRSKAQKQGEQVAIADKDGKTCFIVAPIGSEGTEIRRATEGLLRAVLKPVLNRFGFEVAIAHEISTLGSITDQVVNHLLEADLVVADLSGLNPNVMYELAIRHCAALPVIVIANRNTKLPFDVVIERTIFYSDDMHGGVELARELEKVIIKIEESKTIADNPVTRAKKAESVRERVMTKAEGGELGPYLLEKLDKLEYLINSSSRPSSQGVRVRRRVVRPVSNVVSLDDVDLASIGEKLAQRGLHVNSIGVGSDVGSASLRLGLGKKLTAEESEILDEVMEEFGVDTYRTFPEWEV